MDVSCVLSRLSLWAVWINVQTTKGYNKFLHWIFVFSRYFGDSTGTRSRNAHNFTNFQDYALPVTLFREYRIKPKILSDQSVLHKSHSCYKCTLEKGEQCVYSGQETFQTATEPNCCPWDHLVSYEAWFGMLYSFCCFRQHLFPEEQQEENTSVACYEAMQSHQLVLAWSLERRPR